MSYEKGITTVDEESLIGFLHQNKDRVTAEYKMCIRDSYNIRLYGVEGGTAPEPSGELLKNGSFEVWNDTKPEGWGLSLIHIFLLY